MREESLDVFDVGLRETEVRYVLQTLVQPSEDRDLSLERGSAEEQLETGGGEVPGGVEVGVTH